MTEISLTGKLSLNSINQSINLSIYQSINQSIDIGFKRTVKYQPSIIQEAKSCAGSNKLFADMPTLFQINGVT